MPAPRSLLAAGDRLVGLGVVVFAVGALAALATVVPLFLGATRLPTPVYLAAVICCPVGLGLALVGLLRTARARRLPPG